MIVGVDVGDDWFGLSIYENEDWVRVECVGIGVEGCGFVMDLGFRICVVFIFLLFEVVVGELGCDCLVFLFILISGVERLRLDMLVLFDGVVFVVVEFFVDVIGGDSILDFFVGIFWFVFDVGLLVGRFIDEFFR